MGFIAALSITLGAVVLYERAHNRSDEVAIGCVAVALLGLVISIVIAPWPIQLMMLLGVLLASSSSQMNRAD